MNMCRLGSCIWFGICVAITRGGRCCFGRWSDDFAFLQVNGRTQTIATFALDGDDVASLNILGVVSIGKVAGKSNTVVIGIANINCADVGEDDIHFSGYFDIFSVTLFLASVFVHFSIICQVAGNRDGLRFILQITACKNEAEG